MTKAKAESYQSWECHASDGTHKFDCLSVVDVAIANCEFFSFWFIIIHYSGMKKRDRIIILWNSLIYLGKKQNLI